MEENEKAFIVAAIRIKIEAEKKEKKKAEKDARKKR
jgi:hypothetical protein